MAAANDMRNLSCEELVARAQQGSVESFEALVDRHSAALLGFLRKRVASRQAAEDLRQDILLRVHRGLPGFRSGHRFSGWLYTIAHRTVCNYYRDAPPPAVSADDAPEGADNRDPASLAAAAEDARSLWATAERLLPPSQVEVLWLRYGEDGTIKEIARRTGRSAVHVKVLLHRARRRLAKELADKGD